MRQRVEEEEVGKNQLIFTRPRSPFKPRGERHSRRKCKRPRQLHPTEAGGEYARRQWDNVGGAPLPRHPGHDLCVWRFMWIFHRCSSFIFFIDGVWGFFKIWTSVVECVLKTFEWFIWSINFHYISSIGLRYYFLFFYFSTIDWKFRSIKTENSR